MSEMSQDEYVCLTIMAEGENMLNIGRWQAPIDALAARGFAKQTNPRNFVITEQGKAALVDFDYKDLSDILRIQNDIRKVRGQAKDCLEQAAQNLVAAAQEIQKMTGEYPNQTAYRLAQEILARALEIIG